MKLKDQIRIQTQAPEFLVRCSINIDRYLVAVFEPLSDHYISHPYYKLWSLLSKITMIIPTLLNLNPLPLRIKLLGVSQHQL